jgi:hypothetical protein
MDACQYRMLSKAEWEAAQAEDFLVGARRWVWVGGVAYGAAERGGGKHLTLAQLVSVSARRWMVVCPFWCLHACL